MANQTPEQNARDAIDRQLTASGWVIQGKTSLNFHQGEGQAVREYQTDIGPADYVLFVDGKPVGVVEAKKETLGQNITVVEEQTEDYARAKLKWVASNKPLPFLYQATGVITRFTDGRDPKPRSREVFTFHRPETLRESLRLGSSLRDRLTGIPPLNPDHLPASALDLRDCQERAITNLEASFKRNDPRALIQMATGSGKTFTAASYAPGNDFTTKLVSASVVGGVASRLGGGKFENGAVTGAFTFLFNHFVHGITRRHWYGDGHSGVFIGNNTDKWHFADFGTNGLRLDPNTYDTLSAAMEAHPGIEQYELFYTSPEQDTLMLLEVDRWSNAEYESSSTAIDNVLGINGHSANCIGMVEAVADAGGVSGWISLGESSPYKTFRTNFFRSDYAVGRSRFLGVNDGSEWTVHDQSLVFPTNISINNLLRAF